MAAKGSFNIFWQGSVEPNRQKATKMYSLIATDNNGNTRQPARQTICKRQTFRNEIRLKKNQQKRKVMRKDIIKTLQSNSLFTLLQSLASKDNIETQNIANLIMDIKRNIADLDFCKQLNEQKQIKKYILSLYINNQAHLQLKQKCLLITCLTYLTFYHMNVFDLEQKQKLNETMIQQISQINHYDSLSIEYLRENIELLTNIISDGDQDINHHLLDTSLFADIGNKITEIANEGQKLTEMNPNDHQIRNRYEQGLDDIREAFISTLLNLSYPQYQNDSFFQFTLGQFVGDVNYMTKNGVQTLKILTNFFQNDKFRLRFAHTDELTNWFEKQVAAFCQKKFMNLEEMKTGNFSSTKLTQYERQLFFQFIKCMLTLIQQEQDEQDSEIYRQFSLLINFSINLYFLSEFLIQCSQNDQTQQNMFRKSQYVSQAIKMYEFLASNPYTQMQKLLVVTSERNFEDIFKVLLDQTFFTSHKISQKTISLLNKLLGFYPNLINTLNELGIFQSIDCFLSKADIVQKPEQIQNFFDLLTLMVDSDSFLQNGKGDKEKINYIAMRIDQEGFIPKIENYQNHENRAVAQRAEAFLDYLFRVRQHSEKRLFDN